MPLPTSSVKLAKLRPAWKKVGPHTHNMYVYRYSQSRLFLLPPRTVRKPVYICVCGVGTFSVGPHLPHACIAILRRRLLRIFPSIFLWLLRVYTASHHTHTYKITSAIPDSSFAFVFFLSFSSSEYTFYSLIIAGSHRQTFGPRVRFDSAPFTIAQ